MAREGNRIRAGSGTALAIVRYGRDDMNCHERPVNTDLLPGEPCTLGADGEGRAQWVGWTAGDPLYVVEDARGRGIDAQTTDPYETNPTNGDGPENAPAVKATNGGLYLRVYADGQDETIEPGTVITPDATNGFVVDGGNDVYALADDELTIANGETELVAVEVA